MNCRMRRKSCGAKWYSRTSPAFTAGMGAAGLLRICDRKPPSSLGAPVKVQSDRQTVIGSPRSDLRRARDGLQKLRILRSRPVVDAEYRMGIERTVPFQDCTS